MTAIRSGLDLALDFVTSAMWALAAFFIGARLFSFSGGLLLGLAVFVTSMTYTVMSRLQERRAQALAAGRCPRCRASIATEHVHRRWDAATETWLHASTAWRCAECGFEQTVALACERCPAG